MSGVDRVRGSSAASPSALFALYFALPLLSMLDFSTRAKGDATGRTSDAWVALVENDDLREAIVSSLLLAVFTVVLMVVLLVPTMIWVRLRVPGMSRTVEFLCLLPLTIPALVIVVGIANVYAWVTYLFGDSALTLTFVYVVLVLPYAYRAIDSSLAAIDVVTLAEAARSLGAGWMTVIVRIVFPNIIARRPRGRLHLGGAGARGVHRRVAAALRHDAGRPDRHLASPTRRRRSPARSRRSSSSPCCCWCCSFAQSRPASPKGIAS